MPPAPATSEVQVEPQLGRWAATSNFRRVVEETLAITATTAAAGLVAVGLSRLPTAATHLGWDLGSLQRSLEVTGIVLTAAATVAMVGRAWIRYRRRRTNAAVLARRLDHHHETRDLFTTALAVERGSVHGNEGLEQVVSSRARAQLPALSAPIDRFEAPARAFAAMGLVAALVALMPMAAAADPEGETPEAEAEVITAPPLPEDVLEALRARAKELERLEYTPALKDDAREGIRDARQRLEKLSEDPDRSLSELARAQKALEDLERKSREEGLHDKDKLRDMNDPELAEQLAKAMQRGENDTAAEMAKEFSRRLEEASPSEQDRIGRALERALRRNPAEGQGGLSRSESEARARDRNRLDELSESLSNGDTGSARAGFDELADEMRERGSGGSVEESLGDAAEEIRKAREQQLDEMNGEKPGEGEGEGQGQGEGEGQGQAPGQGEGMGQGQGQQPGGGPGNAPGVGEGEGEPAPGGKDGDKAPSMGSPMGPPGGKPGPGGGDGKSDTKGSVQPSTEASGLAPERVQARRTGPAQGSVRAIRRYSEGYRDTREYKDLHDKYSSVAESAVRREEIPLTRRDYIRSYFQAVRGR
jgi:hypothetical protein